MLVTVVTNQDNGTVSYAHGPATFRAGNLDLGVVLIGQEPLSEDRIFTSDQNPLLYHFSDRLLDIDPPAAVGQFGHVFRQPFSANATDKLGFSLSRGAPRGTGPWTANLTLLSWGNAKSKVPLEEQGNILVGVGANQQPHRPGRLRDFRPLRRVEVALTPRGARAAPG